MKSFLSFLLVVLACCSSFSQITILNDSQKSVKDVDQMPLYDRTENITFHNDLQSFKKYIGQKIVFKYTKDDSREFDCFISVIPDTIWYKKTKKPKSEDYEVITAYKYKTKPFFKRSDGVEELRGYTPASAIAGNIFEITDMKIEKKYGVDDLYFLLKDAENTSFWWKVSLPKLQEPPCFILSYIERLKSKYVGKDLFSFENEEWTKYLCEDIALSKINDSDRLYSLCLVLKLENGEYKKINAKTIEKEEKQKYGKKYISKEEYEEKMRIDASNKKNAGDFVISLIKVEKPTNLQPKNGMIKFVVDNVYKYSDNVIDIEWEHNPGDRIFNFELKNKSDLAIKIIWNEAAYIDYTNKTDKVVHSGIRYIDKNKDQLPTIIPPSAVIQDMVIPTKNIYYSDALNEWRIGSLFVAMDKDLIENRVVKIQLPVQIKNVNYNYIFHFKVNWKYKYPELQ